ncbi:MAG TPA: hypothetical protein VFV15_00320 [Moraxellaceae bacterium]|nr:hypothetical protein [Moraxellaceae bacterium]
MIDLIRKLPLVGTLALAALLTGCGESTNIQSGDSGSVQTCKNLLNVTCVSGRFIDDAAFNVDYECGVDGGGTVRSVTGVDGGFSCPNGSVVTFFLDNPDNYSELDRIELGSVTVTRPAKIYGDNPSVSNTVYFYVTPRNLAGDGAGNTFSAKAVNITRLLQTLSTDTTDPDQSQYLPTRRVVIDDADKRKIKASVLPEKLDFTLPAAADPANPTDGTFDFAIRDYLLTLADTSKHQLVASSVAVKALEKGVNSTAAGIYLVPGGSVLSTGGLNPIGQEFDADTGAMVGLDTLNNKQFVGSFYLLVDRRGRTFGHGVYSYGASVTSDPWAVWSNPQAMQLTQTGYTASGQVVWPYDHGLTQFRLAMLGTGDTGKYVTLTQGNIRRQAVAGSSQLYKNLFAENSTPSSLGTWSMVDGGSTTFIPSGAYSLEHTIAVAPFMNPDLWNDTVVQFPLPVTVSFYNQEYSNTACAGGRGCKIAELRMVILEDGNIVSDRHGKCGVNLNPATLVYTDDASKQEIPLGVVSNTLNTLLDEGTTPLKTMTLLAMLPSDARLNDALTVTTGYEAYIPYIQFGSNLGENSLLRLDGLANKYQMYGYCSTALWAQGLCGTPDTFQPKVASWVNGYTFMRAIKANKEAPTAAATAALINNSGGTMEAQRTPSCP